MVFLEVDDCTPRIISRTPLPTNHTLVVRGYGHRPGPVTLSVVGTSAHHTLSRYFFERLRGVLIVNLDTTHPYEIHTDCNSIHSHRQCAWNVGCLHGRWVCMHASSTCCRNYSDHRDYMRSLQHNCACSVVSTYHRCQIRKLHAHAQPLYVQKTTFEKTPHRFSYVKGLRMCMKFANLTFILCRHDTACTVVL